MSPAEEQAERIAMALLVGLSRSINEVLQQHGPVPFSALATGLRRLADDVEALERR